MHLWDELNSGRLHGQGNIGVALGRIKKISSDIEGGCIYTTSIVLNLNTIDILEE